MKGFYLVGISQTSSFRFPDSQVFHPTLPLPPYSTLIGLAGSACGMKFDQVFTYFKDYQIRVGIIGKSEGKMRDLWRYYKIKNDGIKPDVLIREYLYQFSFSVFYSCVNYKVLNALRECFKNPVYALTLGNSDDLIKINKISKIIDVIPEETINIGNTIFKGNLIKHIDSDSLRKDNYEVEEGKFFLISNLPVDFSFKENNERRVLKKEVFSFILTFLKLNKPIETFKFDSYNVPLL